MVGFVQHPLVRSAAYLHGLNVVTAWLSRLLKYLVMDIFSFACHVNQSTSTCVVTLCNHSVTIAINFTCCFIVIVLFYRILSNFKSCCPNCSAQTFGNNFKLCHAFQHCFLSVKFVRHEFVFSATTTQN